MKKFLPIFLFLVIVIPVLITPVTVSAATNVYDNDWVGWQAAVGGTYITEDFSDATLNPGVSVISDNGYVIGGLWWDRVDDGDWGDYGTTTWTFASPIYAWGGTFDAYNPGGPGGSIKVTYIDGTSVEVGTIPNTTQGTFWGFVSDEPFIQVHLEDPALVPYACETYEMDNMVYSLAQGVQITLLPPPDGNTFWIEALPEPTMPKIVAKAELVGIAPTPPLTVTEFVWKAKIQYTDHGRNDSETFGPRSMLGETWTSWTPDFKNIIMGGEMDIEVSVNIVGKLYQDKISFHIRGREPGKDIVKNTLGKLILQVICYKESYPKWHQFDDSGLPIFGPPSGFGLMQLDPPSSSVQIWSWLANVQEGRSRWQEKVAMSKTYEKRIRKANSDQKVNNLSREQEERQAAYLYRGGCWVGGEFQYYYIWNRTSKQWEVNPNAEPTSVTYADDAMNIREAVSLGNPPEGW